MRVVLTVLDSLPARHVGPDTTPVLHALARAGGWRRTGGRAVMTSSTYPNHATFATGALPERHGIVANRLPGPAGVVAAWERGPGVPTLFDACRAAGRTSIAVLGDQHLVGVMGAEAADRHWPPQGELPDGTRTDVIGYADDRDAAGELLGALADAPDLVVGQLNGPDTAGHVHGPDGEGALLCYRRVDAVLAEIHDVLLGAWTDLVWMVVSDHDQEPVTDREPIDLAAEAAARGLDLQVVADGSAAVVAGRDPTAGDWLSEVEGLAGSVSSGDGLRTTWCVAGRVFGTAGAPVPRGTHGGPRTRAQVAVVTGGHPAVARIAGALDRGPVHAADWGATVADLLDIALPSATGRSLAR